MVDLDFDGIVLTLTRIHMIIGSLLRREDLAGPPPLRSFACGVRLPSDDGHRYQA